MPLGEAQAARAVDGDEVVGVQEAEPLQAAAAQKRAHHERAQVLDARHDDPLQQVVQRIPVRQRVREGGLGVEDSADLLEVLNEPPDPQQVLDVAPRARLDHERQDAHQQQVLDGVVDQVRVARVLDARQRRQEVRGEVLDRLDQRFRQDEAFPLIYLVGRLVRLCSSLFQSTSISRCSLLNSASFSRNSW